MNRFILKSSDGKHVIETYTATDILDAALKALDALGYSLTMHPNDAASEKAKKLLTIQK